ncbi:MAG: hypothetical protein E7L17_11865 [Clostridium sp.]|uniref:hypothetical protein n=1 Tax=Clostridium sp. TaxID=1506 RepID=UPI00290C3339|nr:hypothetical protein [Clostridium sp.]MDU7338799.1 hypothetical protein [Clostridium sp.]
MTTKQKTLIRTIIKIFLVFLLFFVFENWKYLFLLFVLGWLIFDFVKKKRKSVLFDFLIIVYALIIMYVSPVQEFTERIRFYVFESRYTSVTEQLQPILSQENDSSWVELRDNRLFGLAENRTVIYVKRGKDILIYYPTWTNFFRSGGYVYYNSETARDFWEHPHQYDDSLSKKSAYDDKEPLNGNWDCIKIY